MKINFKNPVVITVLVIAGIALLYFGGTALFKAGQKSALQQELAAINKQIESSSGSRSANDVQLIAKRQAIIDLLNKI